MRDSSSIGCAIITDEASPVNSDTGVEDPDAASSDSAIPCGDAGMREGGTGTVDAGEECSEPAACAGTMLGARGLHGCGAARDQGGGSIEVERSKWAGHLLSVPHRGSRKTCSQVRGKPQRHPPSHNAVVTVLQGGRRGSDTAPAGIVDSEAYRENTIARRRPPCGRERLLALRVAHHSNWRTDGPPGA